MTGRWYWEYLRDKRKRSPINSGTLPDLYTRIVCRVMLGWRCVAIEYSTVASRRISADVMRMLHRMKIR